VFVFFIVIFPRIKIHFIISLLVCANLDRSSLQATISVGRWGCEQYTYTLHTANDLLYAILCLHKIVSYRDTLNFD